MTRMHGASDQSIAYQLLSNSDTVINGLQLDGDDEDESSLSNGGSQRSRTYRIGLRAQTSIVRSNTCLNLRQLRIILFLVTSLLFLTFLAQLTTKYIHTNRKLRANLLNKNSSLSIFLSTSAANIYVPVQNLALSNATSNHHFYKLETEKPQYYNYLESVLRDHGSLSDQLKSSVFDDLFYPSDSPTVSLDYRAWWKLKFRLNKTYTVLENYIRAMKSFNENSSITLTTQATTEFMHHSIELCKRWDGPISVAVFCPGVELSIALTLIKFMRSCLPGPLSACIRDKITWHFVYNSIHGPPASSISFPRYHLDELNFPMFIQTGQCPKIASGSSDTELVRQFEFKLRMKNNIYPSSYRQRFNLIYPINVLRNIARQAARSIYVLASDIELYPSTGLVPKFMNMLRNHDLKLEYANVKKFVFVLPIFEVRSNVTNPPRTKQELVNLFKQGDAIFFHKWVCDACQNFPYRLDWLESDNLEGRQHNHQTSEPDELTIFEVTRRDKSREYWEPIFIGTKKDPNYDDRLSWDGRRDKMGQMYEMCLQGYHLFILGNAFLVHAPGIKHLDKDDFNKRLDYIRQNNAIYDSTIAKLKKQYEFRDEIKVC